MLVRGRKRGADRPKGRGCFFLSRMADGARGAQWVLLRAQMDKARYWKINFSTTPSLRMRRVDILVTAKYHSSQDIIFPGLRCDTVPHFFYFFLAIRTYMSGVKTMEISTAHKCSPRKKENTYLPTLHGCRIKTDTTVKGMIHLGVSQKCRRIGRGTCTRHTVLVA